MAGNTDLDELDRKILNLLIVDGRMNYRDIARKLGTTIGTVHNRIKKMAESKVIKKFMPQIDAEKVGFEIVALINVQIRGGHLEDLQQKYAKHPRVCSIYDTTGPYEAVIVGKFRNVHEVDAFSKKISSEEHVERVNTNLVLNVVKESFVPDSV